MRPLSRALGADALAIVTAASEGFWGLDSDARTYFLSPVAERLLGYKLADLAGQDSHAVLHHTRADGSPYPREECPVHRTRQDGVLRRVDGEVFWRRDGRPLPVDYRVAAIAGQAGPAGVVVAFSPVSNSNGDERGRRAEARLARVAQAARVGLWEWDTENGRIWCSDETYRILGRSRDTFELRPDTLLAAVAPAERSRVTELTRRAQTRDERFRVTTAIVRPDGSQRILSVFGEVAAETAGRCRRLSGTVNDVTDVRRLEQQVMEERRRADRLALELKLVAAEHGGERNGGIDLGEDAARLLTRREQEVIRLIASGLTSEEIAAKLGVSKQTVRTHARNMMEKLGARTRAQAVAIALRSRSEVYSG